MFQFQELTAPIKSTTSNSTQQKPAPAKEPSPFLVLTHEPEVPKKPLQPLMNFLVLTPVHSSSYPTAPARYSPTASSGSRKSSLSSTTEGPILTEPKDRRRSSVSSSSSEGKQQQRFLRLNPVHWGGEEFEDDYAIEE